MPTLTAHPHFHVTTMQYSNGLTLQEELSEMELTDSLLFGCDDEVADEPVEAAATAPAARKPVGLDFLVHQSPAVAEVAATVAVIRSTWPSQAAMLTAEQVAHHLAAQYRYGEMVCLRTTCAAAKLQMHQSHTFAVCKLWTGEEVIVDVGFRESIQLGCPTAEYQSLLELLPVDFVGTQQTLKQLLRVVCDAADAAFTAHGMLLPPWRTYSSMLHRWTSPNSQDSSVCTSNGRPGVSGQLDTLGVQRHSSGPALRASRAQQVLAPKHVVVGFPSDAAVVQPGPSPCPVLLPCRAPPPTMKNVSQQIDRLLGPIRKVKLGCM